MEKKKIVSIVLLIILVGMGSYGLWFWYAYYHPRIIKAFPNPFEFNNGTKVKTEDDWRARREEIKELLLDEEYGNMPGRPDAIQVTEIDSEQTDDVSTVITLKFKIIPDNNSDDKIIFHAWMYVPDSKGPFPTVVKVSLGDKEINNPVLERGYILICYNHTELDLDTEGYDEEGPCQKVYSKYNWGSISVWAWGAMRVADYLLGEAWVEAPDGFPDVDPDVLIITGHSRKGKTALLAGALDERFTLVAPNGSGCCGAGSFLVQGVYCETIEIITSEELYKAWFHEDFGDYGGKEDTLKFDQHFLRSLVAPRLIISTDGLMDLWANPTGTQAVYEATKPVYEFLDVEKKNAIHFRQGGHDFTEEDIEVILDFADKMLLDKKVSGDFYMTPFDSVDFPIDYEAPD